MNKDKKMLFGIGIAFLFLATVSLSYAYFTATIANKDVKDQIVTTGTLQLTYTDGPEIVMNNIKPGATITKEVSVKNTGTLNTSYNLVWQELANEIINDEMVIEATCTRYNGDTVEGTCESLTSAPIKRIKIKENVSIEPNIIHKYNITITFKETNADQNYNQGKSFTGTLGINEYVENTPIYCTFDGELTPGAEYVNGQYTYRYHQEGRISYTNDLAWNSISGGWGVQLTDKSSTDPVTSKVCTYINNKPVISMSYMFSNSKATTLDLSSFNTAKVINMRYMFANSKATNLELSSFNTSNVTDMSGMFEKMAVTSIDLSNFNTSNVTNMSSMFSNSKATTITGLGNFDTSNVTNMYAMFQSSQATTLDLSSFNTSNVTDMSYMFDNSKATTVDVKNFDTSKVTDMNYMFNNSQATTLDLSSFDTSNVTYMSSMFGYSKATSLNLSSFNTAKVTDMGYMFALSRKLKTIHASNNFITDNVTNSGEMFMEVNNLVGGNGTKYNSSYIDKTYARIDTDGTPGYFTLKTN